MVPPPDFFTRAGQEQRMPNSRSVAVKMDPVAIRLDQHVRQDRNRGFLLHYALRQVQFSNQIGPADGEFHGRFLR